MTQATAIRHKRGGLYYEELMGEEGFSSDSALLYHRELPTRILNAVASGADASVEAPEVLLPRHLQTHKLPPGTSLLMGNSSVRLSYSVRSTDSPLYRDSDGDLQIAPIPHHKEASCKLPVPLWRTLMDRYYSGSVSVRIACELFDELCRYKRRECCTSLEDALRHLLAPAPLEAGR